MSDLTQPKENRSPLWNIVAEFPLSATQKRWWFLDLLNPGNPALNVAVSWEVRGRFRSRSFERAFQAAIERHEILRTRFIERDGQPVQQVVGAAAFKLAVIDLQNASPDQRGDLVRKIALEQSAAPFDLTRPEPIRATLVQVEARRAFLLFTVHHICFDGWSIGLLGREIGEAACAIEANRAIDLPDLPLQYGDYVLWQEECFARDALRAEETFWLKQLANAPYFEVQPDFARLRERTHHAESLCRDLSSEFGERIETEARRRKMSPFSLGAGVLSAVLHRYTGERDVLFGTQVAGRGEVDLEALIGAFINNLVLRFDVSPDLTFDAHLRRAHDAVQASLMHQAMPFNRLVELVNPPRDPSRAALVSINLIVQRAFLEDARYGDFELVSTPSRSPGAIHDLNFVMVGRPAGWRMTLEYNPDLFGRETAAELLDLWHTALDLIISHPDGRLADIPGPTRRRALATQADRQRLAALARTLESHPSVAEAVVVDHEMEGGIHRPYAFVAAAPDQGPLERLPDVLAAYLRDQVPVSDRPAGISVLQKLPRHASGEILESALIVPPTTKLAPSGGDPVADDPRLLETEIARIWSEVLGIPEIDRQANFFSLGGHSLLVVRMAVQLRKQLRIDADIASVYQYPTIAGLAARLTEMVSSRTNPPSDDDWRIVELCPEGEGVPLIAVNNTRTLFAISKHFRTPRRCVGIRLLDPEAEAEPPKMTFEEIAAEYVKLIRKAQPRGPYSLFGICVHGNLALEIARQLAAGGDAVARVFFKDVWSPHYGNHIADQKNMRWRNRAHDLRVRLRRLKRGEISLVALLGMYSVARRSGLLRLGLKTGLLRHPQEDMLDVKQWRFIAYLTKARNDHLPREYHGDVSMLVTKDSPQGKHYDPSLGWRTVVRGRLDLHRIDDIAVYGDTEIGTAAAAREIETALLAYEAENDGRSSAA